MKKFNNKTCNKLIAKVDRYFTYNNKYVEDDYTSFHSHDGDIHVHVFVSRSNEYGIYVAITKRNRKTKDKFVDFNKELKSFADINAFVTMIKLIG